MGSKIEWTDETWNPVRGCSRVSEGCRHCYAERTAIRLTSKGGHGRPYDGLVRSTPAGPRWTGKVRLVRELLEVPLRWKRPRRCFVNSMGDLFHERLTRHEILAVFDVMARAGAHTFQVLTKRPRGMHNWLVAHCEPGDRPIAWADTWPLPNVWLGTSVEDQAALDQRLPELAGCAQMGFVTFLSVEPLLGPVDLGLERYHAGHGRPDWVIVGGESGPRARPCDVEWVRSIVRQCREHGVATFVKQLGARPVTDHRTRPEGEESVWTTTLRDSKGGDPSEWPEDLRVRSYPHGH